MRKIFLRSGRRVKLTGGEKSASRSYRRCNVARVALLLILGLRIRLQRGACGLVDWARREHLTLEGVPAIWHKASPPATWCAAVLHNGETPATLQLVIDDRGNLTCGDAQLVELSFAINGKESSSLPAFGDERAERCCSIWLRSRLGRRRGG